MKRKLLLLLSLMFLFSSCTNDKFTERSKNIDENIRNISDRQDENKPDEITNSDIENAREIVEKYFKSIKNCNMVEIDETLGEYKNGVWNKENVRKWRPELIKVEYPGKHLTNSLPPSSYRSNYGKDPFKCICLNVVFKDSEGEKDWDYVLIKESKDASWVIHDWGV